jgi:glycosyltransferase involved in cell wall biosynthesis
MMTVAIDATHSTTRRVINVTPRIIKSSDARFERMLFLSPNLQRKGEGGLRHDGYFKVSDSVQGIDCHPLITVITVVFNGEATLEKSILSVINQTYDNVEYILIDGCSTDGTLDIIRKYAHAIDYWVSEPDAGIYDAWNKAVVCASGNWICFIGADDYLWGDSVLQNMVPTMMSAMPSYKLVYGAITMVNSRQEVISRLGDSWEISKKEMRNIMSVPHPGLMHHRTWFENYGLFDASYKIGGDYEMLLRGWPAQDALFVSDLVTVGMTQGGVSSSPKNALLGLREIRRAQLSHGIKLLNLKLLSAFLNVYMRLILQILLGQRKAYKLLDFFRKLFGKRIYWTRL